MIVQLNPYLKNFTQNNIKFQKTLGGAKPKNTAKVKNDSDDDIEYRLQDNDIFYTNNPISLKSISIFDPEEKQQRMQEFDISLIPNYQIDYNLFIQKNHNKIIALDATNLYQESKDSTLEEMSDMSESFIDGDEDNITDQDTDEDKKSDISEKDEDISEKDEDISEDISEKDEDKKSDSTIISDEDEYNISENDDDEEKEYKRKMKAKKQEQKEMKQKYLEQEEIMKQYEEKNQQKIKDLIKSKKNELKSKKEKLKPKSKPKPEPDPKPEPEPESKPKTEPKPKPKPKLEPEPEPKPESKPKPEPDHQNSKEKTKALIAALSELSKANEEYNVAKQLFRDKMISKQELNVKKAAVDEATKHRDEAENIIPDSVKKVEKVESKVEKTEIKNVRGWLEQVGKLYIEADEYIDDISHIMTNNLINILEKYDCVTSDNIEQNGYNDYAECIVDPILDSLYQNLFQFTKSYYYKYTYGNVPNPPSESHINFYVSVNNNEIKQMQTHIDNIMNTPDSSNIGFFFKNDKLEKFVNSNLLNNKDFCDIIENYGEETTKMIEELSKFGDNIMSNLADDDKADYEEFMKLVKNPGTNFGIRNIKMPRLTTSDYLHINIKYPKDANYNKKTGVYETRFLANKKLDYKLPIEITQADTQETIKYVPISVAMWHGAHYTAMINVDNKWIHIDDQDIHYHDCDRKHAKPIGIIYMNQNLYQQRLETGTLRTIDDIKGITNISPKKDCWCNAGIQMLLNIPEIWESLG